MKVKFDLNNKPVGWTEISLDEKKTVYIIFKITRNGANVYVREVRSYPKAFFAHRKMRLVAPEFMDEDESCICYDWRESINDDMVKLIGNIIDMLKRNYESWKKRNWEQERIKSMVNDANDPNWWDKNRGKMLAEKINI